MKHHYRLGRSVRWLYVAFALLAVHAMPPAPKGFEIAPIAVVPHPRELAATPNGDLLIGTSGSEVYILPQAEGVAARPSVFATVPGWPAAGVAVGEGAVYVSTPSEIYRVAYEPGDRAARAHPHALAAFPNTPGTLNHRIVSVVYASNSQQPDTNPAAGATVSYSRLYAGDGVIISVDLLDGNKVARVANRLKGATAFAVQQATGDLWVGAAGASDLPASHGNSIFTNVTGHMTPTDYEWPSCQENCTIFPAGETPAAATFYPPNLEAPYAFPQTYLGGAFVALSAAQTSKRTVVFVRMRNNVAEEIDWNDPTKQWQPFLDLPVSGIAVGSQGSLFLANEETGVIYRVRPR